jgi:hypothetical protein
MGIGSRDLTRFNQAEDTQCGMQRERIHSCLHCKLGRGDFPPHTGRPNSLCVVRSAWNKRDVLAKLKFPPHMYTNEYGKKSLLGTIGTLVLLFLQLRHGSHIYCQDLFHYNLILSPLFSKQKDTTLYLEGGKKRDGDINITFVQHIETRECFAIIFMVSSLSS